VHVANVGDARAHLLTPGDGSGDGAAWQVAQLTSDDSAAAQAAAAGIDVGTALSLPGGHAITAWLGADAPTVDVHLSTSPLAAGDVVLACSDGLWNYAPTDEELAGLVSATLPPPGGPLTPPGLGPLCEQMATWANDQGGADNVTVALAPAPAPAPGSTPVSATTTTATTGRDPQDSEREEPA